MTFMQYVELCSGAATGLLWLAYSFALGHSIGRTDIEAVAEGLLSGFIGFGIAGLLVAFGAYFHVVRQKSWGRTMLKVGTGLLIAAFLLLFFGGIAYWGMSVVAATMLPPFAGVITVMAAKFEDFDQQV